MKFSGELNSVRYLSIDKGGTKVVATACSVAVKERVFAVDEMKESIIGRVRWVLTEY